jgi:hypothetical protein
MKCLAVLGLGVLVTLAVTAVSAVVHPDMSHTNDFTLFGTLGLGPFVQLTEVFAVLVGGIAASVYLARRRDNARGVLGVGLYSLISGTAFVTVFSFWLSTDDIILDTAFVGALLAMVGTALAIASALTLRGRPTATVQTVGWLCGVVAFLAVGAGGINVPVPLVRPQFIVLLLVVAAVGLLTCHRGQMLLQPLLLSAGGTILTILDLLVRGPGDWASGSDTVKLSSFPLIVMGIALSLAILQATAPGRSLPRGRRGNTLA